MYVISELKSGRNIVLDGEPYKIVWNQFSKSARQGGVMATKLKNLKTGAVMQKTFQGSDKVEQADVSFRKVQFLYSLDGVYTFMDLTNYDQFELTDEMLGDTVNYLIDGQECDAQVFEDVQIGINIPATVNLKVIETTPGLKGDTATGGTKPATLESGLVVSVPLFITEGDVLKINTDTGMYMSRVE